MLGPVNELRLSSKLAHRSIANAFECSSLICVIASKKLQLDPDGIDDDIKPGSDKGSSADKNCFFLPDLDLVSISCVICIIDKSSEEHGVKHDDLNLNSHVGSDVDLEARVAAVVKQSYFIIFVILCKVINEECEDE